MSKTSKDILAEICARKAEHVLAQKELISLEALKEQIKDAPCPIGFIAALEVQSEPALIAEVKKASPSKGLIRADFDPVVIAKAYKSAGATCLSVLTDEPYFQGCDAYFRAVKDAVSLPVLRKDFMIEPYQIYESRALGADCILLIMAALSNDMARVLYDLSTMLGMDVLIEVHNAEELERTLTLSPRMIGVNNRNLKTLKVDVQTSFDLLEAIPQDVLKIAESGIAGSEVLRALYGAGYNGFLVGESLMRQDNIEDATRELLKNP